MLASTDRPGESWARVEILPVSGYYITRVIGQLRFFQISKYALILCVEYALRGVPKLLLTDPVKEAVKLQRRVQEPGGGLPPEGAATELRSEKARLFRDNSDSRVAPCIP
jgi:hypothetical protein